MSRRFLHALTGALAIATAAPAAAQTASELSLRTDNDAFNFWLRPYKRSDDEYTSGVRIVYDNGWMPWWRAHVFTDTPRCDGLPEGCVVPSSWIGQEIYNPARDARQRQRPRTRPNAGWLYFSEQLDRVSPTRLESLRLTIGVTGPPALGSHMQQFFHDLAPRSNRPIDWTTQIGFEPGVIARYERGELLLETGGGPLGMQLTTAGSVSAGNVLTEATGTLGTRIGWSLDAPWSPATISRREVALSAEATARAVGRDLFLDGNTFRESPRVEREPFVFEQRVGATIRWDRFRLGYHAHWTGRTYVGGPKHIWSSMTGGVVFTR